MPRCFYNVLNSFVETHFDIIATITRNKVYQLFDILFYFFISNIIADVLPILESIASSRWRLHIICHNKDGKILTRCIIFYSHRSNNTLYWSLKIQTVCYLFGTVFRNLIINNLDTL